MADPLDDPTLVPPINNFRPPPPGRVIVKQPTTPIRFAVSSRPVPSPFPLHSQSVRVSGVDYPASTEEKLRLVREIADESLRGYPVGYVYLISTIPNPTLATYVVEEYKVETTPRVEGPLRELPV